MIKIQLDHHSAKPIYLQIAEQLRDLIAMEHIKPGDRLPPVRQLAHNLDINQNTVVRAYLELGNANIISSKRGGGTTVTKHASDPTILESRHKKLMDTLNEDIIKSLSLGYSPEEIEAAFYLNISRWREERQSPEKDNHRRDINKNNTIIRMVGSHDIALDIAIGLLEKKAKGVSVEKNHLGSLDGLIALQENRADFAGTHLLDEETGEYNNPYVKRILPGKKIVLINIAFRIQGLMFASGNPRKIKGIEDLTRSDLKFLNRQKGSGTRVLLDFQLKNRNILPSRINGYNIELDTHLAVATKIARGEADVGLGIEAAAKSCSIGFLPFFRERYDVVIPIEKYKNKNIAVFMEILQSTEFKKMVEKLGGYDTLSTGSTSFIE